jgi:hypothetical protein
MHKKPVFVDDESNTALLANDRKCREHFGAYRDSYEDMVSGVARWVMNDGTNWHKPTYFGRVRHDY